MDNLQGNGLFFKINEVAKQVGVVPATIRNWEKSGLISVRRTPSGYRVFDLNDIEYLKKIKQKSKDENLPIESIKMLTAHSDGLSSPGAEAARQTFSDNPDRLVGSKWKESRLRRNYSLEDVSNLVGISASYLSKIENGQAHVSYDILQKLASFYGENILFYLNDPPEENHLVKNDEPETFEIGIPGLELSSLIARHNHTLSALLYSAEPGTERSDDSTHNGEEFVYVLSGKVEFILNGNNYYLLSPGDSISFNSTTPHRWRVIGSRPAKYLWVYTPLVKL